MAEEAKVTKRAPRDSDGGTKEFSYYIVPNTSFWGIKWKDGGQVPAELTGWFTDEGSARFAAKAYLDKRG